MSFLTSAWTASVRARARHPHMAEACCSLDAQASEYRASVPALPEQQAGYYHDFFCPEHAVQLTFDPHSPHHHMCSVDRAVFTGEPFDSAWLWSVNDILSDAALKLAFRAFLFADHNDASIDSARAKEILLGYADRYRMLPRAPGIPPKYPGHALWSSLDESVWIIRLAWAYSLMSHALSTAERMQICEGLMQPAADHIRQTRRTDIHNVTNWNNAALTTLAISMGDQDLLVEALDGPAGLRAQLAQGVRPDGLWWEGSLSYHYYTLAALVWTLRVLRASGRPWDDNGILLKMFAAPIALAFPDLSLPAMNDCWYAIGLTGSVGHGIPDAAGFYETAYGWYGDSRFAWILGENYARHPRTSFEALIDGAESIPAVAEPSLVSAHMLESGIAVLRTSEPRERQTCLILKASPRGSSHDHPDQLSIQLFARGAPLSLDLGTPGYGVELTNAWYRETLSHNTVLLDGRSQPHASAQITQFEIKGNTAVLQARAAWSEGAYAGVKMHRVILWNGLYFVDAFSVVCAGPHQIDWAFHSIGELCEHPEGEEHAAGSDSQLGYSPIRLASRIRWVKDARFVWRTKDVRLAVWFALRPGEDVFMGDAPGNPATERLSFIARRQTGSSARFLSVFYTWSEQQDPVVRRVLWPRALQSPEGLIVETTDGLDRWIVPNPDG